MSPRRRREPRQWTTDDSVEQERLAKRLDELQAKLDELADLVRAIDQRVTDLEEG